MKETQNAREECGERVSSGKTCVLRKHHGGRDHVADDGSTRKRIWVDQVGRPIEFTHWTYTYTCASRNEYPIEVRRFSGSAGLVTVGYIRTDDGATDRSTTGADIEELKGAIAAAVNALKRPDAEDLSFTKFRLKEKEFDLCFGESAATMLLR